MKYLTDNTRITGLMEVSPPVEVIEKLPISEKVSELVFNSRKEISDILHGNEDRLVVVVGPCSIHDPKAAIEYAKKLKTLEKDLKDQLKIVMRVYFEKPRTTVGWKGLINDPDLDNSYDVNKGLKVARKLLLKINELGFLTPTDSESVTVLKYGVRPAFLILKCCTSRNPLVMICNEYRSLSLSNTSIAPGKRWLCSGRF